MKLEFSLIETLFLSVLLLLFGYFIRKKIKFLHRFCIPAPVIGGLLFSIFVMVLKELNVGTITLDVSLQSSFMLAFFTTVGLGASFSLVRQGGKLLIVYWLLCGFVAIFQNVIGVSLAQVLGIHPLLGVMAGAVSMEGGHGAAGAFGPTVEELGVQAATTIGFAAATFGLIFGSLIGGPVSRYLINKYDLKPETSNEEIKTFEAVVGMNKHDEPLTSHRIFTHICLITFCMCLGVIISKSFAQITSFVLPEYVGAMFLAVIIRNLNDRFHVMKFDLKCVNLIGDVSLGIFLSMALMNLKIWEIFDLAVPLFVILVFQVLFIILYGIFVVFRLLGKDYDAAVMVGGLSGHALGGTPNAMANMGAITERYGESKRAFLIVPVVGAFLIDLFGIPSIISFINFFK
ncbi:sodium/glutamate symporter [Aneurinibacillus thermoaerophilus]|uniref:Sodium/glutamate symporter n=1 Tax=Aneurinibacillus thermoaerophilus TaxID=143495 RepID=A0ABX8Y920_ANETH|nr:sodium/glutamate symporter [Aneurinibacillus thermoaerophilus]MED0681009.1 sodium/glutamate symporter [Aneurinibacillus thermoaerophilus]MED0738575.1 sodium/glutamate symporter [Aneurinibacillus thermoaerophilus]MED0757760.1 sodium/glutamate symporter [Aneurinibacillus thermoaerophilus]MED0762553.1 sodium/glutamate symporter [Aneurinibacillus thermoaerophilus]MED0765705.1 sodium/glutamate symporter [Aneurinibacillus thermoaerophilus]